MPLSDDAYPQKTVVYIEARFGDVWRVGSGVLVGRNDVLTASHVVYRTGYGAADEVIVYPSYDPSENNVSFRGHEWTYYSNFDPNGDGLIASGDGNPYSRGGSELDIALITLTEPAGDTYGWMGMRDYFQMGPVHITGYPTRANGHLVQVDGTTYRNRVDNFIDLSGSGVSPGSSGGPVWIDTAEGPRVVGVVSTTSAAATVDGNDWLFDLIVDNDVHIVEGPPAPLAANDLELVAATYQFFTGSIPALAGFRYLIDSRENTSDLNDPYYAGFNIENRYINFASNLGTAGQGAGFFDTVYGALSFADTIRTAYLEVMGREISSSTLNFFLNAQGFYRAVAAERVVRPGVDLAEATKIVAIGSILNEAVKSGDGRYGDAVDLLVADVLPDEASVMFGRDMFDFV